jgi:two-component system cell cycle response regulator DivK
MTDSRILLVEDDERNRRLARDILTVKGYEVVAVTSGEEALAWLVEHSPDLILMDIQLPGISGLEAMRQIRRDGRHAGVPIVAFTASVMPSERQRIVDAGFDGLLAKPVELAGFLAAIRRYLEGA